MQKISVKLLFFALTFALLLGVCYVGAAADENLSFDSEDTVQKVYNARKQISDGGFYTIEYRPTGTRLSCDGEVFSLFDGKDSRDLLFEFEYNSDMTFSIRALYDNSRPYLCYEKGEDGAFELSLCERRYENTSFDVRFNGQDAAIYTSDGEVFISLVDDGAEIGFSLSGEGYVWRIKEYRPESFTISQKEIRTKPYTVYEDLRVLVSPSFLTDLIEWDSSDRDVAIVDDIGRFCSLSEGKCVLYGSIGAFTLSCEVDVSEDNNYIWFSQKNVTDGGWNGGALYNIYFRASGVKKRFAVNKGNKNTSWMPEGCAICSVAMVLNNMGARYTNGYDFRSGLEGNLMADPYTVALANTNNKGATSAKETLSGDPVYTVHKRIADRFNVGGAQVTVQIKYTVTKKSIKEALDKSPWGVVVCFENQAYGKHYIVFNKCINPDAKYSSQYQFLVSDPVSFERYDADNVLFEKSYSYRKLNYRFSNATIMQVWDYER